MKQMSSMRSQSLLYLTAKLLPTSAMLQQEIS